MLIDDLFTNAVEIHYRYWVSKPVMAPFIVRLRSAWRVLRGREVGVEFAEDKFKYDKKWSYKNARTLSRDAVEKVKKDSSKAFLKIVFKDKVLFREDGEPRMGRNDPCLCGSGMKWKKCHGKDKQL